MKSKRYIAPTKKRKAFVVLLNIAVIVTIISSLMQIFFDHDWKALLGIAIPLAVVTRYKNRKESTGYYEPCIVAVSMDERKIKLEYESTKEKVEFFYHLLNTVEYSNESEYIRFIGTENIAGKQIEHFLYLEKEKTQEFLEKFEECNGRKLRSEMHGGLEISSDKT